MRLTRHGIAAVIDWAGHEICDKVDLILCLGHDRTCKCSIARHAYHLAEWVRGDDEEFT